MTTRRVGPEAGFGWLKNGIGAGFAYPKPLFGGAALLAVAVILPSLVTVPMQFLATQSGTPLSTTTSIAIMVISALYGLLVIPLYAGYLQVIRASRQAEAARASDIFQPYRRGEAWPLIGLGLLFLVLYVAGIALIVLAAAHGLVDWFVQVQATQAEHVLPPALPGGFWLAMALFSLFYLWMMGVYAISLGQVALNRRPVLEAIRDGMAGAWKNGLPLLVFALSAFGAGLVIMIAFVIVVIVLALLAKLVSVWLTLLVLVPLYVGLVLWMFTVMFSVSYHLWHDVCGEDAATPPPLIA